MSREEINNNLALTYLDPPLRHKTDTEAPEMLTTTVPGCSFPKVMHPFLLIHGALCSLLNVSNLSEHLASMTAL